MNRRGFIQLASAALASIPLVRSAFARSTPKPSGVVVPEECRLYAGIWDNSAPRPTVKVTGVWLRHGYESAPYECEVNESAYIELPKIHGPHLMIGGTYGGNPVKWHKSAVSAPPDAYRIYAPHRGFHKTGPWYFLKEVKYRDAKRSRFTVAVDYQDSDLVCQLMPGEYERQTLAVTFPKSEPDQTHWMMYGGEGTPIGIFPA